MFWVGAVLVRQASSAVSGVGNLADPLGWSNENGECGQSTATPRQLQAPGRREQEEVSCNHSKALYLASLHVPPSNNFKMHSLNLAPFL